MKSTLLRQSTRQHCSQKWLFSLLIGLLMVLVGHSSVDAVKIVYQSSRGLADFRYNLYVMNTNEKKPIKLTKGPASDITPVWSPDGRKIAFSSDRDGDNEIYVMNADGTNPIQLTHNMLEIDIAPSWSAGGRKIAFSSYNHVLYADVYVMNADGTNLVNLTQDQDGDDFMGSWHPTPLTVSSQEKLVTLWGRIKQNRVK